MVRAVPKKNMNNKPQKDREEIKVSVIIPIYNRANVVGRTLDSVRDQTHYLIELILIDDGSTDESWEVVEDWLTRNKRGGLDVKHYKQKNSGAPSARNRGLEISTGKYIQFLDSDDWLLPEKIAKQVHALEESQAALAVCDYCKVTDTGTNRKVMENNGRLRLFYIKGGSVSIFTPLIQADLIKGVVRWNETFERNQDIDFLFKVFAIADSYIYTKGVWCIYVLHDGMQISDRYSTTNAILNARASSLMKFLLNQYGDIPLRGKLMLAAGSIKLWLGWIKFLVFERGIRQ